MALDEYDHTMFESKLSQIVDGLDRIGDCLERIADNLDEVIAELPVGGGAVKVTKT
jgi:uncharacterized protein (UPF0335 family)